MRCGRASSRCFRSPVTADALCRRAWRPPCSPMGRLASPSAPAPPWSSSAIDRTSRSTSRSKSPRSACQSLRAANRPATRNERNTSPCRVAGRFAARSDWQADLGDFEREVDRDVRTIALEDQGGAEDPGSKSEPGARAEIRKERGPTYQKTERGARGFLIFCGDGTLKLYTAATIELLAMSK